MTFRCDDFLLTTSFSLFYRSATALAWPRCLFTQAFFVFLRKSNLIASSPATCDPVPNLCCNDIKSTPHGAVLRIRWSKTLQHKDRLRFVPLPSIPGSDLYPVSAILQYFSLVSAPPSAPFFCIPFHGPLRPVTHAVFTTAIKSQPMHFRLESQNASVSGTEIGHQMNTWVS